jgi:vitamin B12 transporter
MSSGSTRGKRRPRVSATSGLRVLALIAAVVAPAPIAAQWPTDSVVRLPGLEVSAASRLPGGGVTRAAEVLDQARLQTLAVSTISEALRWGLGVDLQARSPAQADVSLRGGSFEQVLVLVDGIPVSDAQTGHFDLDLSVPLDLVERIEIVRGQGSSLYGTDAVGGVINVVTRTSGGARAHARLEGGSFGSVLGAASFDLALPGAWQAVGSVQGDRSDGHREGVDHKAGLGHAGLRGPLAGGQLQLQAGWASRDFGADGFYAPAPSYEETRTQTLSARWDRQVGSAETTVMLFRRGHDDDFILRRADPSFYRNLHTTTQNGAEASLRLRGGRGLGLVIGGQAVRHDLRSTNLGDRDEVRGGVFAEGGLEQGRLRLRAGARLEGREGFGSWLAPSASTSLDITSALRVRASVGRSYRTPTFTERFYTDPANVARADVAAESALSTELGVDWAPLQGIAVRSTWFRREARDLIDWARPMAAPQGVPWETRNVGRADFEGFELQVEGVAQFDAAASWLSVDAGASDGFESKYALRPLTRALQAGVQVPLAAASTLNLRVREQRRRGEAEGQTVTDLRVSAPAFDGQVWIDLTNAFDADYPDISGKPAPGRALRSGIRLPLGGLR